MALIELKGLRRRYGGADSGGRLALDGVDLEIDKGESVAVLGTSGSGKSTLLHVVGGLDVGYEGQAWLAGHELKTISDDARAGLRQRTVGFVFQGFHLVPGWSVRQNVALPEMFSPEAVRDVNDKVDTLLRRVGLDGRGDDDPRALSGGQRQRVAIARALLLEPELLLCDEPTGSLDHATGDSVLALFEALHSERGLTLVVVTHETRATEVAHRVVRLEDGRVVDDVRKGSRS